MIPIKTLCFLRELVDKGIIAKENSKKVLDAADKYFDGYFAIGWDIIDIQERADLRGISLTHQQSKNILESVHHGFDATIGINWDVIDTHTDMEIQDT